MKKTLFWNSAPIDAQGQKDSRRDTTVMGARLYGFEMTEALLRYSSYDTILLPARSFEYFVSGNSLHLVESHLSRVQWIEESDLPRLNTAHWLVMSSSNPLMHNLSRLRDMSKRPNTPLTGAIHAIHESAMLRRILSHLLLGSLHTWDALICQSQAGKQAIQSYFDLILERLTAAGITGMKRNVRLAVIPEGINFEEYAQPEGYVRSEPSSARPGTTFLYFGRLSAYSKADLQPLLLTFASVHASEPNTHLVIAGDDTQCSRADALRSFAAQLRLEDCVEIVADPSTSQKRLLYANADVFVSPVDHLQETFGRTVVEAMAAGLPVIASDWNGYRNTVVHNVTGFLVRTRLPRFDSESYHLHGTDDMRQPDMLAATTIIDLPQLNENMLALARNPDLRCRMGAAGRERARTHFDWPVIVGRFEELWNELHLEASCSMPSEGLNLHSYPYFSVFRHYATSSCTGDEQLHLNDWQYEIEQTDLLGYMLIRDTWFSASVFKVLLGNLRSMKTTSFTQLVALTSASGSIDNLVVSAHLLRLIKYGVVTIASRPVPDVSG